MKCKIRDHFVYRTHEKTRLRDSAGSSFTNTKIFDHLQSSLFLTAYPINGLSIDAYYRLTNIQN